MEHVVFFTSPDGASLFRRTPDLESAVRAVEHLRNVEGVEDAQVFSLAAVPLAFRTYVKVEVPSFTPMQVPGVQPETEPEVVDVEMDAEEPEPEMESEPEMEPESESEPEPVVAEMPPDEPMPEPEPVVWSTPEAEDEQPAFQPVPGMDVLPSEEYVAGEHSGRNGKSRGMGFFTR